MVPPIHTSLTVPDEKDCDMPKPVPPVKFAIADPDAIQETLCDGPFNVSATAGRATITFTHVRPKIEPLLPVRFNLKQSFALEFLSRGKTSSHSRNC